MKPLDHIHFHFPHHIHEKFSFLKGNVHAVQLIINIVLAIIYFAVIMFAFEHGHWLLFSLLAIGEAFHLFQIIGFSYTIWGNKLTARFDRAFTPEVDVFITVCGEPVEIVEETARAALAMNYPNFKVHLLNDGYVAGKEDWRDIVYLAKKLKINAITRTKPGGAKAGNINHAVSKTSAPYFVVFDADHVPKPEFLRETMGYFVDKRMGFVQTPQFYKNQSASDVAQVAWDQQTLFFGPIMRGKNRLNAAFMCGTNMIVSRKAVIEAGGMCEFNIAEDFLTSLFIHAKGWNSVYVPKVLAEGLAPEDFLSYYKQQFRWTRGSLEVIFRYNPLFMKGLSIGQKWQYLISASYYLTGIVVLIDMLLPVIFLLTGLTVIKTSTMMLAFVFLPYIMMNLYVLQKSSGGSYSYNAIAFSLSAFWLQIQAVIDVLRRKETKFVVTPKSQQQGNFAYLCIPHFIYIAVSIGAIVYYLLTHSAGASFVANVTWIIVNTIVFIPFIKASLPAKPSSREQVSAVKQKQHVGAGRIVSAKAQG